MFTYWLAIFLSQATLCFSSFLNIMLRAELKRSLLQQNIQKVEEVGPDWSYQQPMSYLRISSRFLLNLKEKRKKTSKRKVTISRSTILPSPTFPLRPNYQSKNQTILTL